MKQFLLEKWLQDKSRKVVTRDGREVRILCIDCGVRESQPILVEIICSRNAKVLEYYNIDGTTQDKNLNLFFADEEKETIEIPFGAKDSEFIKDEYFIPEGCKARIEGNKVIIERVQKEEKLTEFEKEVKDLMNSCCNEIEEADITNELVKEAALNLLDLARKKLQPEFDKELDKAYKTADDVQYQHGKQDALKDLPRWKKTTENKEFDKHILLFEDYEDRVVLTTELYTDEYYIELDDLKKLPKEE